MSKVNIVIGRFQPFTLGHYKCIENAFKTKGIPTVIAMVETGENKLDEKHPFPSSLLLPLYKDLFDGDERVADIILVKNADIVKIGEGCMAFGYEIASWTCGTDRIDSYRKMSDKYHDKAGLSNDFTMIEVPRTDEDISATKVRKALLDNDKKTFVKLTPPLSFKAALNLKVKYGKDIYDVLREQILKVYNK